MVKKKLGAIIICLGLMLSVLFSGCSQQAEAPQESGQVSAEQKIIYNLGAEPETLDPAAAIGAPEATVQLALFEGLVRLDANNQPLPGMAERWKISDDGRKYTFYLRDAKWSNGDPVTAYDFEYTWKRLLNPDLGNYYAYQLYYVKNAEKYNSGQAGPEDVGIRALDEKTLEVELNDPTPYFISLVAFPSLYPVNKTVVEEYSDWHTSPANFVSNGPFKLVEWEHNQKLVLTKNENYWAASDVKLDTLEITMVDSDATELTMFETGQIDIAENPPLEEMERLLSEKTATVFPDLSVYFYVFNLDKKPLNDLRVRRALSMAINRQELIEHVTQAFERPAFALVPYGVSDVGGTDFRETGGDYFQESVSEAKQLLADAGYSDGKNFPPLKLLVVNKESNLKIAEAIQEMWRTNLGINIEIISQEWGVYGNTVNTGDFDIAQAGWMPDYNDAMTYLDLWIKSDYSMYYTGWQNPDYDKLIDEAKTNGNPEIRSEQLHQAETILIQNMPVMPIYFYTNQNMYKPWVKDVVVPTLAAYQDFRWAYVEK